MEPGPQRSDRSWRHSSGEDLPTLSLPVLAGESGESIDSSTLWYLLGCCAAEPEAAEASAAEGGGPGEGEQADEEKEKEEEEEEEASSRSLPSWPRSSTLAVARSWLVFWSTTTTTTALWGPATVSWWRGLVPVRFAPDGEARSRPGVTVAGGPTVQCDTGQQLHPSRARHLHHDGRVMEIAFLLGRGRGAYGWLRQERAGGRGGGWVAAVVVGRGGAGCVLLRFVLFFVVVVVDVPVVLVVDVGLSS